jgi:hypothetical protein
MKLLILVLALSLSLTVPAAELDATASKEISYLIGHLGSPVASSIATGLGTTPPEP